MGDTILHKLVASRPEAKAFIEPDRLHLCVHPHPLEVPCRGLLFQGQHDGFADAPAPGLPQDRDPPDPSVPPEPAGPDRATAFRDKSVDRPVVVLIEFLVSRDALLVHEHGNADVPDPLLLFAERAEFRYHAAVRCPSPPRLPSRGLRWRYRGIDAPGCQARGDRTMSSGRASAPSAR